MEKKNPEKPSLSVLGIIIAHYLLGLGIAALGKQVGNDKEFYAGLIFTVIYLIMAFHRVAIGQDIEMVGLVLFPLTILSWAYIIGRFIMLKGKVKYKII